MRHIMRLFIPANITLKIHFLYDVSFRRKETETTVPCWAPKAPTVLSANNCKQGPRCFPTSTTFFATPLKLTLLIPWLILCLTSFQRRSKSRQRPMSQWHKAQMGELGLNAPCTIRHRTYNPLLLAHPSYYCAFKSAGHNTESVLV